jgi:hypothetical protein
MEAAATPEVPGSNPEGFWGGSPKRKFKPWLVLGLGVVALGLIGFVALSLGRDPIAHSVSVTFLCYTNIDSSDFNAPSPFNSGFSSIASAGRQRGWAWFRITNRSRFTLDYDEERASVEHDGKWIQETNLSLGEPFRSTRVLGPGQSETVSVLVTTSGTRWRNSFLLEVVEIPPWELKLERFVGPHLPRNLRLRIDLWLLVPRPRVVTSETITL